MSWSPLGRGASEQAPKICNAKGRVLREGRKRRLIAIIKTEEFQATRARVGDIQHRIGRHLILPAKMPLLGIRSSEIGRDGIEFRSVGFESAVGGNPLANVFDPFILREAIEQLSTFPAGKAGLEARFPHGVENDSEEKNGGLKPGLGLE